MKMIIQYLSIFLISCNCSQKTIAKEGMESDSMNIQSRYVVDSLAKLPTCIKEMIKKMETEPVTNPPGKVYSYTYNNKTVYYVPAICCDFFSDLYDDSCKIIAHPDGGFTGRGDGKIKDFEEGRKNEKLIWADKRK
jgi:hypothetical protein